jgi:NDP-sugar pyrophosphorylase family protein
VVSPEVAGLVPADRPIDMTRLFELARQKTSKIMVFPISEYWLDVGRSEDFIRANADFEGHFGRP